MRFATYNVEWFNNLFDNAGNMLDDDRWSGRYNVKRNRQLAAIASVFKAMDADAIMLIEAPDENRRRSTVRALEGFAAHYGLRTSKALLGFENDTQQEIALLYDPAAITVTHDPQGELDDPKAPRFDGAFSFDLDTDAHPELVTWSKPPLEIAATVPSGRKLRLIGVHAKSKAPHGARNEAEAIRIAIENRRKQLAQCVWLRRRVDQVLAAGDDLIVMGDFNDGPGLDEYEKLFGHSGIEVVLGEGDSIPLYDPHAKMALSRRVGALPSTSRFKIGPDGTYLQALLDYIMISPELTKAIPRWRIWHPFDNPACFDDPELREALIDASDHFPVTIDLDL
ncbi:endonuclease [Marivivens donghaensis]|uniref:Endonuclease n=1 Tax=Marivivens donghaensis TaxID=1699413 RepID=A0ABX0VW23_9RHOB|nr:endonuclease/exonuclease/phosphatase family protein [Marivivens donghaensis]NIY72263.1 endonuclease [Marivivens donghaensis]